MAKIQSTSAGFLPAATSYENQFPFVLRSAYYTIFARGMDGDVYFAITNLEIFPLHTLIR
jgi:hypothetical protein